MPPNTRYRLTLVRESGQAVTSEFSGYHAEHCGDTILGKEIESGRWVYARLTLIDINGSLLDLRREWIKP